MNPWRNRWSFPWYFTTGMITALATRAVQVSNSVISDQSDRQPPPPVVAILIPAFQAEATIQRAVASALAQTVAVEVIVIDDASPDQTAAIAQDLDDGRGVLKVLTQPQNAGPAAARNLAIAESSAPWIALLDADDWMEPERLANLLDIANAHGGDPAFDMVADDLWRVHEYALDGPRTRLLEAVDFTPFTLDFATFVLGNLHGARGSRGEYGFLKPLMRRGFLEEADLSYDPTMRLGEDYDLYARALSQGRPVSRHESAWLYRGGAGGIVIRLPCHGNPGPAGGR